MTMRVRLVPILLFFGVVLLALKAAGLGQEVTVAWDGTVVDRSQAQATANTSAPNAAPQTAAADNVDPQTASRAEAAVAAPTTLPSQLKSFQTAQGAAGSGAGGDVQGATTQVSAEGDQTGQTQRRLLSDYLANFDNLTQSELEVLQALQERREEIDRREDDVIRKEAELEAIRKQIERKVAELQALQDTIQGLLVQHDEQEEGELRRLVKIYEVMKPKDAARVFNELDMPIMLDVLQRMKERLAAPILAHMDPDRAKAVTVELAQRRQLPIDRE